MMNRQGGFFPELRDTDGRVGKKIAATYWPAADPSKGRLFDPSRGGIIREEKEGV